jgi:hypothetical protein
MEIITVVNSVYTQNAVVSEMAMLRQLPRTYSG